jgi:hypothetical protein
MMHKQSMHRMLAGAALAAALVMPACESAVADRILAVDAQGTVVLVVFVDENADGQYNPNPLPGEPRPAGVQVNLQLRGDPQLVSGGLTDSTGLRAFTVPIGRYRAVIAGAALGDSLEVAAGTQEFTVGKDDSVGVLVSLSFVTRSIADLRALPLGSKTWVRGVVLNSPVAFGDSTVHLSDDSVAIRASGVRPQLPILQGDTVRFLGRRALRDGQPSLQVLSIIVDAPGSATAPDSLTTLDASTAQSGSRDARLVTIAAATVADTLTLNGNKTMTVDDGSGPLTIVLSRNLNFNPLNQWRPGIRLDVVGLLVPNAGVPGSWVLKPRNSLDLTILP